MSMQADVERLMARLLTDRELRERFIADPARVALQQGLSAAEAEMIARMSAQDLRTAGRGYEHKRNTMQKRPRRASFARWLSTKLR
jgi:hypothetical protein